MEPLRSIKKMYSFREVSSISSSASWATRSRCETSASCYICSSSLRAYLTSGAMSITSDGFRLQHIWIFHKMYDLKNSERVSGKTIKFIAYWLDGVCVETTVGVEMPWSRMYKTKSLFGTRDRSTFGFKLTIAFVLLGVRSTLTGWLREATLSSYPCP